MQGSARKDVVFGAARVYTVAVPGPKWRPWVHLLNWGMYFTPDYPTSCGWPVRLPRRC